MLAGELYDPLDPELVAARTRARDLCQLLNATREGEQEARRRILTRAVRQGRRDGVDAAAVLLRLRLEHRARGAGVLQLQLRRAGCVPRCGSATTRCSVRRCRSTRRCTRSNAELRRQQEYGKPVEIGSDVWVGGGALILPGVRIGSRAVIGAGQRGDAGYSGGRVRGRQSVPRDS